MKHFPKIMVVTVMVGLFVSNLLSAQTPKAVEEDRIGTMVAEVCSGCHTIEKVSAKHLSATEWRAKVLQMIQFGAPVDDADAPAIAAYLAKHYGPLPPTGK